MAFHLDEPLGIDPCVDVVFLRLFGGDNEAIRVDFLNAVLAPASPIRSATVINAVQMPTFDGQAGLRLDLKVRDEAERTYQVEMQRKRHKGLDKRMLYGWARLYADQLGAGKDYDVLHPVVSIWICEEDAFPTSPRARLRFTLREEEDNAVHHTDIRFEVIQLAHVSASGTGLPDAALGGWCRLLNEAADWNEVPPLLQNPLLEAAMGVLNDFRTNTQLNSLYPARLDFEREQFAIAKEKEEALAATAKANAATAAALADAAAQRAEKEQERAAKEQERAAKEQERAAKEQERAAKEQERAAKEAAQAELDVLRRELAAMRARQE